MALSVHLHESENYGNKGPTLSVSRNRFVHGVKECTISDHLRDISIIQDVHIFGVLD